MEGGKLIVFSAPSGSGKTTIVQHLLKLEIKSGFFNFCNFKRAQKRRVSRPRLLLYKFKTI
jgi:guanylate kinase